MLLRRNGRGLRRVGSFDLGRRDLPAPVHFCVRGGR
jgi:hypothetical protein